VMREEATKRAATPAEIDVMVQMLRAGLTAGGLGFSSSYGIAHSDANGDPAYFHFGYRLVSSTNLFDNAKRAYTYQLGLSGFVTDRAAMRAQVDGVIFGDNPAQGIVRGTTFLHPPLRFRLDFPAGWQVANSPQQVMSKAPNADVVQILQLVPQPQGSSVEAIGVASMEKAGFRLVRGERATLAGLEAHVGEYDGMVEGLGQVRSRATHVRHGDNVYMIAGLAAPGLFSEYDTAFTTSQRSFRPLSASEADAIKPARIALYTVRPGDTWQSLAARSAGAVTPAALAAMNHAEAASQPQAGAQIKVVVAG